MFNDNDDDLPFPNYEQDPCIFDWEEEYFKQFKWLENQDTNSSEQHSLHMRNVFLPMLQSSMGVHMYNEPQITLNPMENRLYMYFISLEENKMFLYVDFKEENNETLMQRAQEKYGYIQIYKPLKIVFTMEVKDLYDIDKTVKLFMHMFGINNTRGGSYTSLMLEEEQIRFIEKEREVTCIDHYTSSTL